MTASRTFTIRARHVLPIVGPPIDGGWVRVERGRIVAVGRRDRTAGCRDLGDCVLLPGLVNAHAHLEFSSLGQPLDAAGGLPGWIGRVVAWRRAREAGPEAPRAIRDAIAAGLAESTAAGVTTIADIATSAAASDRPPTGPRLRVFREGLGLLPATIEATTRMVARDLDSLARAGVCAGVSPHAPDSVAAPLGRRLVATARDRHLPVAMHIAESEAEQELLARGTGPFRNLLESLGAWDAARPPRLLPAAEWISRLARSSRGIVVHATHIGRDPDALSRVARHRDRLCVAVCPRTTRAISGVLPPLALLHAAGIRVCLGTDGRGSNPDLSILAECRTLVDAGLASPAEALAMATHHGAWGLGFDRRCGALTPGRAADLLVLRPAAAHPDPFTATLDPATQVVTVVRSGHIIHGALPDHPAEGPRRSLAR
ncbi:MAG: amidohydrolase family protein [Planctomycetaceae bacterium]